MDTKTIVTGAIVLLAIGGLFVWGAQNRASLPENSASQKSALAAAETPYDFGTISMKNGNVEKTFEIMNPTDTDIALTSLTTSCMCTTAYIVKGGARRGPFGMPGHGSSVPRANEVIPASGRLGVAVIFDPNAHGPAGVGTIDRFVYLEDETGGVLELEIKANVTP
ncbi:MAG: hypothetical protein UY39_C0003G0005 [Candidatus Kaiserbacteria bacterium GW2011_GWC2_49_12]|uniref:DUF1573 domain-containing protein n=4 Tax=Candidatus Kaiseribacteriota TaxID=1752734 RepID=A0A0G1WGS2_9BACT|nr:MAG: hypothetical protein UY39_C0003G0005 [Candidatus Kaiserbacteria bacterium GW2011_GWC2_49_12]KKW17961.1 MAG: hypothetical protein UY57_C0005G0011 [Candidatus Kaiserbacteria bacterium GW2011_GWB1_50_17]KKW18649.1 MAG: hypothetical protein UY59_C0001G0020 [Candidatus Kaiserbacteria bacterium GW2011_GWA1_50_28]OGG87424.1 MAG: hypothetical protein A3H15_02895 [Candidatus Kaiserbacteria bacterium RIFCSPLOWO2_12_FULL_50_28]HCM43510.1 hypothetical protein [Candidatus Kaiserbacteria bacterium]